MLYTYYIGREIYGDDPDYVKTWDLGNWKIRWGFEDWTDMDFNDFVLVTEDLGDGRLKITVESTDAGATADMWWKGELVMSDLLNKVGESVIVTGIPVREKVVELYEKLGGADYLMEPTVAMGYWILGVWVRKVRPRRDVIKSEDHNVVKEVLKRAVNLLKEAGYS